MYLMPEAKIAIRHLLTVLKVDQVDTRVKGFRILINERNLHFAMHAIILTEPA